MTVLFVVHGSINCMFFNYPHFPIIVHFLPTITPHNQEYTI